MSRPDPDCVPDPELPPLDLNSLDLGGFDPRLRTPPVGAFGLAPGWQPLREFGDQGENRLEGPLLVTGAGAGELLVLDHLAGGGFRIRRFHEQGDAGAASDRIPEAEYGGLRRPTSLVATPAGDVWIADAELNAVLRFSGDGRWLESRRGEQARAGSLQHPRDAVPDLREGLLIADCHRDRVVHLGPEGGVEAVWESFANPLTGEAEDGLHEPAAVCLSRQGWLFIADTNNQRVLAFQGPELVAQWSGGGLFEFPARVRLTADETRLVVLDNRNRRFQLFPIAPGRHDAAARVGTLNLPAGSPWGDGTVLGSGLFASIHRERGAIAIAALPGSPATRHRPA